MGKLPKRKVHDLDLFLEARKNRGSSFSIYYKPPYGNSNTDNNFLDANSREYIAQGKSYFDIPEFWQPYCQYKNIFDLPSRFSLSNFSTLWELYIDENTCEKIYNNHFLAVKKYGEPYIEKIEKNEVVDNIYNWIASVGADFCSGSEPSHSCYDDTYTTCSLPIIIEIDNEGVAIYLHQGARVPNRLSEFSPNHELATMFTFESFGMQKLPSKELVCAMALSFLNRINAVGIDESMKGDKAKIRQHKDIDLYLKPKYNGKTYGKDKQKSIACKALSLYYHIDSQNKDIVIIELSKGDGYLGKQLEPNSNPNLKEW